MVKIGPKAIRKPDTTTRAIAEEIRLELDILISFELI